MNPAKRRHTFGFATAMVIVLIGLLAVILSATATRATTELRRTANTTDAAQVSRLLAAAVQTARAQAAASKPVDGNVQTPLGDVALRWQENRCEVTAGYRQVRRSVTLAFEDGKLNHVDESAQ
jgi:type II secretory pathway component PulK